MKFKHVLCGILVALLWGVNFSVCKIGLKGMPQFFFACLRFFFTAVPLLFFIKRPKTDIKIVVGIGLAQGFISMSLTFYGISLGVPVGLVSLLFQVQVVFSVLLGLIYFKMKPTRMQTIGLVIATLGMCCVAYFTTGQVVPMLGILSIIGAGFFWAVGNILTKKAGDVDSLSLIVWSSFFASVANFIILLTENTTSFVQYFDQFTVHSAMSLLYTIVGATLVAATMQSYLFKVYSPTQIAPYSLLVPIFGLFSSWVIFNEQIPFNTFVSSCIVFLGLVINQWPKSSRFSFVHATTRILTSNRKK